MNSKPRAAPDATLAVAPRAGANAASDQSPPRAPAAPPAPRDPSTVRAVARRIPQKGVLAAAVVLVLLPGVLGHSVLPSMILAGTWGIAAVGLGLLAGRAGLVSLGQGGIAAVGAYAAAYASARWAWPAEAAIVFGTVAGVATALLTSPICRLSGFYLATATLTLAVIVQRLLVAYSSITGGANGFTGIRPLTLLGFDVSTELRFFYLVWAIALLAVAVNVNLLRSRFGRALDTIHAHEPTAAAAGISVARHKAAAWVISGGYAALAGALYAFYSQYLSPDQFPLPRSIELIAAVVVGGAVAPLGPLVGIVALTVLPTHLNLAKDLTAMLAPALLVIFASFFPRGIVPHVRSLTGRVLRRRAAAVT